jgi:hypothetical protein
VVDVEVALVVDAAPVAVLLPPLLQLAPTAARAKTEASAHRLLMTRD